MSRYVFLTLAILTSPVPALAAAEQVGQDQPATREIGSPLRRDVIGDPPKDEIASRCAVTALPTGPTQSRETTLLTSTM